MFRLATTCLFIGCACTGQAAERVVSLDYCADQYVLEFVDAARIAAVSPNATREFSYLRDRADNLPSVRPVAEDILTLKPDLVVRSYGGGATITPFLERLGIEVLQIGYIGSLEEIEQTVLQVSRQLGRAEQGERLVARMARRLTEMSEATRQEQKPSTLYMTPTGVTSGSGTLMHDMILAAGLSNFQAEPGWRPIPLEHLLYRSPDVVALAFFESLTSHTNTWSAMRHPIAQQQTHLAKTVPLRGAWTACGGWFLLEAIEALHAVAAEQTDG